MARPKITLRTDLGDVGLIDLRVQGSRVLQSVAAPAPNGHFVVGGRTKRLSVPGRAFLSHVDGKGQMMSMEFLDDEVDQDPNAVDRIARIDSSILKCTNRFGAIFGEEPPYFVPVISTIYDAWHPNPLGERHKLRVARWVPGQTIELLEPHLARVPLA